MTSDDARSWDQHHREHEILATAVRDASQRTTASDDDFLTRREANVILEAGATQSQAAMKAHEQQHTAEKEAVATALEVAGRDRSTHEAAHDREHTLHAEKHASEAAAVHTALEAVARERQIHAEAHEREHVAHQREHGLAQTAIEKAERANDIRFNATNAFREQLNDIVRTLATKEVLETLQRDTDRRFQALSDQHNQQIMAAEKLTQDRYESNRAAIVELQKGDVKAEGRGIGQGAMVAYIVTAIGIVGALLSIIVVFSNFITASGTGS